MENNMKLKAELYAICTGSKRVAEAVAHLFLKNDITNCCEESFLEGNFLLIKESFKEEKAVTVGFAHTLKASSGKQNYGTIFIEIPKNIQELYTLPIPPLERPPERKKCF